MRKWMSIGLLVLTPTIALGLGDPPRYEVVQTGIDPDRDQIWRMNSDGLVVGKARYVNGQWLNQPVVWDETNGARTIIPHGVFSGNAADVNELGHVVGWFQTEQDTPARGFFWSASRGYHELSPFGDPTASVRATAITESGRIVGQYTPGRMPAAIEWSAYDDAAPSYLRGVSNERSDAFDADKSLFTVGASWFDVGGEQVHQAYLARTGSDEATRLGGLDHDGMGSSRAMAITNYRDVVGYASIDGSNATDAFIWNPRDGMSALPRPDGMGGNGRAFDISAGGFGVRGIVGQIGLTGVLWDDSGAHRLFDLLDDQSPWLSVDYAWSINSNGDILAAAESVDGGMELVVLRQIPAPGALTMLAMGYVAFRRRR